MANKSQEHSTGKDDIASKVAIGATGVALAAGAVAAGVLLSSRRNRSKIREVASKAARGYGRARRVLTAAGEEVIDRYQSYQHRIGKGRGRKKEPKRKAQQALKGTVLHEVGRGKVSRRG